MHFDALREAIRLFEERSIGQREWLATNHPEVAKENKYLDEGTPERAYWHAGSASALNDVVNYLRKLLPQN